MKRYLKIAAALAAVAGAVAVIVAYNARAGRARISIVRAARGEVREFVEEKGKAVLDLTRVLAAGVSGILEPVGVQAGDEILDGAVLARIDGADLETRIAEILARIEAGEAQAAAAEAGKPKPAAYEQAGAAAAAAEKRWKTASLQAKAAASERDLAGIEYERAKVLSMQGAFDRSELDRAKARFEALEARSNAAEAAAGAAREESRAAAAAVELLDQSRVEPEMLKEAYLAQAKAADASLRALMIEKERLEVKAPFDCVVLERLDRGGNPVQAGTPVLLVGAPSTLQIETEILSDDTGGVVPGKRVEIFGGALGDLRLEGNVIRVFPSAFTKVSSLGIEQQRVKVRIAVAKGSGLSDGYHVETRIIVRENPDALRVPFPAVYIRGGIRYVLTVENGILREREIIEGLSNDEWIEIVSGLAEGQAVVSEAREGLKPGMEVDVSGGEDADGR